MTKEECEHIIRKATETGLALSEVKLPDEEITDKFASEKLFNLVKKMFLFGLVLFISLFILLMTICTRRTLLNISGHICLFIMYLNQAITL